MWQGERTRREQEVVVVVRYTTEEAKAREMGETR